IEGTGGSGVGQQVLEDGNHYAEHRREAAAEKAERIVRDELKSLAWSPKDLRTRRKGDADKVRIARACAPRPPCPLSGLPSVYKCAVGRTPRTESMPPTSETKKRKCWNVED